MEKKIRILHIASLHNLTNSGVGVVVPQHVTAQQKFADVGLINIFGLEIPGIEKQIKYMPDFSFKQLVDNHFIPDIVVFHEVYHLEFCKIASELNHNNVPYIIVPHGCLTIMAQKKKYLKKKVGNRIFFKKFIQNAIAIQCLSELEKQGTGFQVRKFIGTNGVILPEVKKTSFSETQKKIVYIGRLDMFIKGMDLMLDALCLKREFLLEQNCKIYIYGPNKDDLHEMIKKKIQCNALQDLVVLGHGVFGTEKEKVLLSSDIFIQTSRFEGMPMGVLEALSYGLPCIVTTGTNTGDIIEKYDAGWVAETNAESIADKLETAVFKKTNYKIKSQNARTLIENEFVWDKVARDTIEKYDSIINQNVRGNDNENENFKKNQC